MKSKEDVINWMFIFLPVIIFPILFKELFSYGKSDMIISALGGMIGGMIGFGIQSLIIKKSNLFKIIWLTIMFSVPLIALIIIQKNSNFSDKELLEEEWITQKIGNIEFHNPNKLNLQPNEIPESVKWFYSKMNIYSDEGKERITSFLETKILIDTVLIENTYSGALKGMLKNLKIKIEDIELEVFIADEEEISAMFTFNLNKEVVNGYGYMYKKNEVLESIWLMPLKRGFSTDYIEEFDAGIFPDY